MDSQSHNLKEILSLIKKCIILTTIQLQQKIIIIMQVIWGYFALETTRASDCLCCERNLPRSGSHTSSVLLQLFLRCYVAGKQWLVSQMSLTQLFCQATQKILLFILIKQYILSAGLQITAVDSYSIPTLQTASTSAISDEHWNDSLWSKIPVIHEFKNQIKFILR